MKDEGTTEARALGCRVDYLTIAFRVELSDHALSTLRKRAEDAHAVGAGAIEIALPGCNAELRPSRDRGVDRWMIRNGDLRGKVGLRETGGWTIELHVRAAYLATHTLDQAIELCEQTAAAFGPVRGSRVRRLDLAADFAGFPLEGLSQRWVIPRRGKLGDYRPEIHADDRAFLPERRTFRDAYGRVTGYTVCAGGDLSARVYDKTAELRLSGREEKAAIEHARWSQQGWQAGEQVTRVEFQLRGVVLDELRLRDPRQAGERALPLRDALDPLWRYLTGEWLQLLDRDLAEGERASRVERSPIWSVVRSVTFIHDRGPVAVRVRRRGGATHEQALGAALSALAGAQLLPRIAVDLPAGETEGTATAEASPDERHAYVTALLLDLYTTLAMEQASHFTATFGRDAPAAIGTRWNATFQRFRSIEDRAMPPRWTAEPVGTDGRTWTIRAVESTGRDPDAAELVERDGLRR